MTTQARSISISQILEISQISIKVDFFIYRYLVSLKIIRYIFPTFCLFIVKLYIHTSTLFLQVQAPVFVSHDLVPVPQSHLVQPSGLFGVKLKCNGLHISHTLPVTFVLQLHWPPTWKTKSCELKRWPEMFPACLSTVWLSYMLKKQYTCIIFYCNSYKIPLIKFVNLFSFGTDPFLYIAI